nr:sensor histidine kinase [Deinobacterium chartae]
MRRPLQQLILAANLLEDERLSEQQRRLLLERLIRATEQLRDLSDLNRLQEVYAEPRLATRVIDLRELLARATRGAARVQLTLTATPVVAEVDPARLEQVIANLLDNALKYAPPETPVRVSLEARPGMAVIAVEDDGPGIPEVERARLFEPFFRGSRQTQAGGLGLGLAIAQRFVKAHGGYITLREPPAGGSRFEVWLPTGSAGARRSRAPRGHSTHEPLSS